MLTRGTLIHTNFYYIYILYIYIYIQDECHRQHQTKGLFFEVSHISRNVFIHCRTWVCHFFLILLLCLSFVFCLFFWFSIIVFIIGPFKIHQNGMTRSIRLTHTRIGTDCRHRGTIPYLIYILGTTTTTIIAVVVVRNRNVIIVLQYLINILLYL